MLVLTRRVGESLYIGGDQVRVEVVDILDHKVRLAVRAPKDVAIQREESQDPRCGSLTAAEPKTHP